MFELAQRRAVTHRVSRTSIRVWQGGFGEFSPSECWSPPVNVYRMADRVEICAEIAQIDPARIDVRVEPGRLIIRGDRPAPEPVRAAGDSMCILAMEIDNGLFCREIQLPGDLNLRAVTSEYKNGLLWIRLPIITTR